MAHDVVVAGGGPAGLAAASELASMGYSVLVLEDDLEIGYPVKCAGIVSSRGLEAFRRICGREVDGIPLRSGEVEVRGLGKVEVNLEGLGAFAIDRRKLEKCLFDAAASRGAQFRLSERVVELGAEGAVSRAGVYRARAVVDARGAGAYPRRDRLLHAIQYACRRAGGRAAEGYVRVTVDKAVSREYFTWHVELGDSEALIGGAGSSPKSVAEGVESALARERCAPYRVVRSPIVVGGFVGAGHDGVFRVGDAAGASKPLTGGGDVWGVESSSMAALAVSRYLSGELDLAGARAMYRSSWRKAHGREESAQRLLRAVYEHMTNEDVWRLLGEMRASGVLDNPRADFDGLGSWAVASLGARAVGAIALARLRDLLRLGGL